jgi:hypothetical protein
MARRMDAMEIGHQGDGPTMSTASVKPRAKPAKKADSATSKPATKKAPPRKAAVVDSDSDEADSDSSEEDVVLVAKKTPAPRRRAAVTAKPVYVESDSEDGAQSDASSVAFSESEEESDYCPSD